jgi:hypothetical protein
MLLNEENQQAVVLLCRRLNGRKDIGALSAEKKAKVYRRLNIPPEENLLAFLDSTMLKFAGEGLAVTSGGIHAKTFREFAHVSWEQFSECEMVCERFNNNLFFGPHGSFNAGYGLAAERAMPILQELQSCIKRLLEGLPLFEELSIGDGQNEAELTAEERSWRETWETICAAMDHGYLQELFRLHKDIYGFCLGDALTAEQRGLLYKVYPVTPDQLIYGFINDNVLAPLLQGVLIWEKGILLRNISSQTKIYSWAQFAAADLRPPEDFKKNETKQSLEVWQRDDTMELFQDLQLYLHSMNTSNNPLRYKYDPAYVKMWNVPVTISSTEKWMISENGMPHLPLHAEAIFWAAETGQLDPAAVMVWKPGLSEWLPLSEMPNPFERFGMNP